jgi:glycosyltransferase involved in cell wall biosynthesis
LNIADITVVVCSRNNASTLDRCLESVSGFGEIIVVDRFSTDTTLDIARRYPAVVYRRRDKTGGGARDWGYDRAAKRWVLFLNADEELTPGLKIDIEAAGEPSASGYRARWRHEYLGGFMRSRVFPRETDRRLVRADGTGTGGPQGQLLPGEILRHGFSDIHAHFDWINRVTSRRSESPRAVARLAAVPGLLLGPFCVFVRRYFAELGIRDGARGFLYCLLSAHAVFIRYAKIRESGWYRTGRTRTGKN